MTYQHNYTVQCHSRRMFWKIQENTQIKYNSVKANNAE